MTDYELLRKYEPILYFTKGELFFPCAVDEYIKRSSLWLADNRDKKKKLASIEEIDVETLGNYKSIPPDHTLYLRFVQEPMDAFEYQQWLSRPDKPLFSASGRLSRVGLFTRILDSLFDISLLIRGSVPGGTTAAAEKAYRDMRKHDPRYVYYARVIRDGGYIVLHYLFFYVMNNWRSSYYGVNDHEADWEQVFIYLCETDDNNIIPCWLAYASHEFSGDDLRRRWDDPELRKIDTHPIVFSAAGSHACYFEPGEYLMRVQPAFVRPIKNGFSSLQHWWREKFGQGDQERMQDQIDSFLRVPFIDYARGDGMRIGPNQDFQWSPILLDNDMTWVENYRGLWGLDTRDIFGGERAPAGPKFTRNSSIRRSWYDPLGWAGLNKVFPYTRMESNLTIKISDLQKTGQKLNEQIFQKRKVVRSLGMDVYSLKVSNLNSNLIEFHENTLMEEKKELDSLLTELTQTKEIFSSAQHLLERIKKGDYGDPQSHIKNKHSPEPPLKKEGKIVEIWSALSTGLLLLTFISLIIWDRSQWFKWIILIGGVFFVLETTIRKKFVKLLLNVTIILAVISAVILVKEFWWYILIFSLIALVVLMLRENVKELRKT